MTIKEATEKWVDGFNAIPMGVVEKLMQVGCDEVREVTPIRIGDRVCVSVRSYREEYGEIVGIQHEKDAEITLYRVRLDGCDENEATTFEEEDVYREDDGCPPMWGTMWAFSDSADNYWLEEHLQEMADCGFRIYEQEDYDYIFGIDGAGYDFYEHHWIPLYKARRLHWHSKEAEEETGA